MVAYARDAMYSRGWTVSYPLAGMRWLRSLAYHTSQLLDDPTGARPTKLYWHDNLYTWVYQFARDRRPTTACLYLHQT